MVSPKPNSQSAPELQEPYRLRATLSKAAVLSVLVVGLIAGGMVFTSGTALLAESHSDNVSDAEQLARIKAFDSLKDFPVDIVSPADVSAAVESMHLAPPARDALLIRLGAHSTPNVALAASPALSAKAAPQVNSTAPAARAEPPPAPQISPAYASAASNAVTVRLAWITLWDSDVEDGDAVRIDSEGYSRTVVLANHGVTFAIPVPLSGKISLTGIRDGDGGGITVGVASGPTKAVLPIMSVGQVLNLNVKVN
jgi:hypothetical protein